VGQLFHHSGLEPFADDSNQASVGNALLQHANQPAVINVIKETLDVRFDNPPVLPIVEDLPEFLGRVARTTSGPIADAFVDEVGFPNGLQNHLHCLLYNLVF